MAMVKESRIVFGINDIAGIRIQCAKCKAELILDIKESSWIPGDCPLCKTNWVTSQQFSPADTLLRALLQVLGDDSPMATRLELKETE